MNDNPAESLLKELKNLNKVLKEEVRIPSDINNSTFFTENSSISGISSYISTSSTIISAISGIPSVLTTFSPIISVAPPFKLTYDNLGDFILQQSQELVLESIEAVKDLKLTVVNTIDAEAMSGLANVIRACTGAIDTLNDLNLEAHKAKNAKELKILDIEGRKDIVSNKKPNQTINLIATRDQMLKMMEEVTEKQKQLPAIDAEFTETTPKEPVTSP